MVPDGRPKPELLDSAEGGVLFTHVAKGGFWVASLRIVQKVFEVTRLVILLRLLVPEDFGLVGIAMLTMGIVLTFSQTGLELALVQRKGNIRGYLDSAWTVGLIRASVVFALLYFGGSYATTFFEAPGSAAMLEVIALSVLLQGATNIAVVYFDKELEFHRLFIYRITGTLADFAVTITCALLLRNAYALAFGYVAGTAVRCVMSYVVHPYRPRLRLDMAKAAELFVFGKWIFGSGVVLFFLRYGDDLVVSKIIGVSALALYQAAFKLSNIPATEITHVISRVAFPAYAKLQDDIPRLKDAFLKVLKLTAFLAIPVAGLIFILARDFTVVFLESDWPTDNPKWLPMVPAMQVLAVVGLFRSIGATTGPLFNGLGRPRISTIILLLNLIVLAVIIYPFATRWNILGAAWAVLISCSSVQPLAWFIAIKTIHCRVSALAKVVVLPLIATFTMMAAIAALRHFVFVRPTFVSFLVVAIAGSATYMLATELFDRALGYGIKAVIREQLAALRR